MEDGCTVQAVIRGSCARNSRTPARNGINEILSGLNLLSPAVNRQLYQ